MRDVSISYIVPTLGRPSLRRTLKSLAGQIGERDEVIVVADMGGSPGFVLALLDLLFEGDPRWRLLYTPNVLRDRGYTARNIGMADAKGTHLAFVDDDDAIAPGAVGAIREADPDLPTIYRMRYHHGGAVVWQTRELRFGNVGTPMIVVPNDPARLGRWEGWNGDNGGDFAFVTQCAENFGGVVWDPQVVCIVRPE